MKPILFILACLTLGGAGAQSLPDKGDYLMVPDGENPLKGYYIFKKPSKVYYGYSQDTKKTDNAYKTSPDMIRQLFDQADKIDFANLKNLPRSEVGEKDVNAYRAVEYRKDGKVYRIGWLSTSQEDAAKQLNDLTMTMDTFW